MAQAKTQAQTAAQERQATHSLSAENTPDSPTEETLEMLDPIAERIRMIGQDPPANPNEMADLATVAVAAPHSTMREMAEKAQRNLLSVIKGMRDGAKVAEDRNDPGTVDLFSRSVQIYEKQEWWLRDILRKDDGLTNNL